MTKRNLCRYFKTSPKIIRQAVKMYIRFPLSLRNVENLLDERGIGISHETVRYWWNRFGPLFAAEMALLMAWMLLPTYSGMPSTLITLAHCDAVRRGHSRHQQGRFPVRQNQYTHKISN